MHFFLQVSAFPFCPSDVTYYVDANGVSVKDVIEVVCRKLEQYDGSCVSSLQQLK